MKILAIPYTHTLSHISRPLAVAKELSKRGHEIVFAGEGPKKEFIAQQGFEVLPLHEPDPEVLFGNIRRGRLRFVSDAEVERMLEADIALFRHVKPDIVLTDGRFTAPIATQIEAIPHFAIVNVSSTEYRAHPYIPFIDKIPKRVLSEESSLRGSLNLANLKVEMAVFDSVMDIFKKLSAKYHLRRTVTATNCLEGKDVSLLADIPEYFPTRNLPGNYHYVGPLTWESSIPPPLWWPPDIDGKPIIYVTMGTTGIGDFFRMVHELFSRSQMIAVIATGAQAGGLVTVPGKIYIEPFIDGDLVMEECDLVVCHGGNGTIYQALRHGKPVIGIPTIPDQKFNMRRVEALNFGRTLSWKDFLLNPATLTKLIDEVASCTSFYRNARQLKDILSRYTPAATAADIIERVARYPH